MTDSLKESLSALMDHEADPIEVRRILKEIDSDSSNRDELLESWRGYHLVSDVLKQGLNDVNVKPSADFLTNIQSAIADEQQPAQQEKKSYHSKLYAFLGQGAIAACVALAVFVSHNVFVSNQGVEGLEATSQFAEAATQEPAGPTRLTATNQGGEFVQGEHAIVASLRNEMDDQARDRLRQAVYKEFEQEQQSLEIPVSFNLSESE